MDGFENSLHRRRLSLDDAPVDVLEHCVSILLTRSDRPGWVTALCTCSRTLHTLMPSDLHRRWLESALQFRPTSAEIRAMGLLKNNMDQNRTVLQKALRAAAVSSRLKLRPQPESLLERGVLKASPGTSPCFIEARHEVKKALIKQTIERTLCTNLTAPGSPPLSPS